MEIAVSFILLPCFMNVSVGPKGFLLKSPLAQGHPGPERPRSIASGGKADEATAVARSQFGVGVLFDGVE